MRKNAHTQNSKRRTRRWLDEYGVWVLLFSIFTSLFGWKIYMGGKLLSDELSSGREYLERTTPYDIQYGANPNAEIIITEYASLTCGHCRRFHEEIILPLKKSGYFQETGRFVFRSFPLDRVALDSAVLLSCVDEKDAPKALEIFFEQQKVWAYSKDPQVKLKSYLKGDQQALDTCVLDKKRREDIVALRFEATQRLKIKGTPTIFINGRRYLGPHTLEDFSKALRLIENRSKAAQQHEQ